MPAPKFPRPTLSWLPLPHPGPLFLITAGGGLFELHNYAKLLLERFHLVKAIPWWLNDFFEMEDFSVAGVIFLFLLILAIAVQVATAVFETCSALTPKRPHPADILSISQTHIQLPEGTPATAVVLMADVLVSSENAPAFTSHLPLVSTILRDSGSAGWFEVCQLGHSREPYRLYLFTSEKAASRAARLVVDVIGPYTDRCEFRRARESDGRLR